MVVFQIISSIDIGGAEQVALNIAKYSSSNIEYHIVEVVESHSKFSDSIKDDLRRSGIKFHTSPFKNNKLALMLFWCWFWVPFIKYKPNVLHSHTEVPDLSLWIFRKFSWLFFCIRPKYVRTIHNTQLWNKWKWVARFVEPFYQRNGCNVAISDTTKDCYEKYYGSKVPYIIHNGIPQVGQKKLDDIDTNKINILFAGRFEYQKGPDIMVEVVQRFADNPKYMFYIIGAGSEEPLIKKHLGNQSNVVIKDKIFDLKKYLGAFDYLLIPSRFEGLALLPIEASFAHTPSIISDCPGLRDTFPKQWPLKSKLNYSDDYIAIIKNLQKGDSHKSLGNIAYNYVKKYFSVEKMVMDYEKLYNLYTADTR